MENHVIFLIVPQSLLAPTQRALRQGRARVPLVKYTSYSPPFTNDSGIGDPSRLLNERYFKVLTNLPISRLREVKELLDREGLGPEYENGHISHIVEVGSTYSPKAKPSPNKFKNLVDDWMKSLPSENGKTVALPDHEAKSYKYILYDTLLLLPVDFQEKMGDLLRHPQIHVLYTNLSKAFQKPRIAINTPIPREKKHDIYVDAELAQWSQKPLTNLDNTVSSKGNEKRSPSLIPLFGGFGPFLSERPSQRDLSTAYWERTCQNGITQVWAPQYTMFSNGNLSEKKRVLEFKSLKQKEKYSVVDLYGGIGYFAFSYAKAGASKVLCWDINAWSTEGMRRGAEVNGWSCQVISAANVSPNGDFTLANRTLIAFNEDNTNAAKRIKSIRKAIPPVRHVNCGLLPTSQDSWKTAVQVLDPKLGGWIHIHENCRIDGFDRFVEDLESVDRWEVRKDVVCELIEELIVDSWDEQRRRDGTTVEVSCPHLEIVKEYAPYVFHCVFDIYVEYGHEDVKHTAAKHTDAEHKYAKHANAKHAKAKHAKAKHAKVKKADVGHAGTDPTDAGHADTKLTDAERADAELAEAKHRQVMAELYG